MVTINVSNNVKEEFKKLKIIYAAYVGTSISENEFLKVLLDRFKEKKQNDKH